MSHTTWQKVLDEVEKIDCMGGKVDEGIKDTVVTFRVLGFPTHASCEGHIRKHLHCPYIMFKYNYPEFEKQRKLKSEVLRGVTDLKERQEIEDKFDPIIKELRDQADRKTLGELEKIFALLEEFYKERKVAYDAKLTFSLVELDNFLLESEGAKLNFIFTPEEQNEKLTLYQKEMRDFTEFLKKKIL